MSWMLVVAIAWAVLAVLLASVIGRGVRLADRREAARYLPAGCDADLALAEWLAQPLPTASR